MHVLSIIAAESNSGSSAFGFLLPLILIGAAMYFLMIRPQRRKMRQQSELQSSIEVGDEVMTTSGIYGFVTSLEGEIAWLEIDDDVQIRIARAALTRKVDTAGGSAALPSDSESEGSSKVEPAGGAAADEPSK
ncbi:MAG TPA: preprotein translocase subunit YajC [Ilumatobacteraceae bacterium]|jgi:preprotein translocase subunit YajC|nr:preprotein translocase subunit YajC [Ilumatobacteraceae bacterium]